MKNIRLIITIFITTISIKAQTSRWQDYFAYTRVNALLQVDDKVYVAAENGIFSYNYNSGDVNKLSKASILNEVGVSSIAYNTPLKALIVGYKSGEVDVITPTKTYNFVDLALDNYQGNKAINNIFTQDKKAVLATNFGILILNLEKMEFSETTFFEPTPGTYIKVNETVVLNNEVYAATEKGIYHHPLDSYIANFLVWTNESSLPSNNFSNIVVLNNQIVATQGDYLYVYDGVSWLQKGSYTGIEDIKTNKNKLSLTLSQQILNFDSSLNLTETINFPYSLNTGILINDTTYGGAKTKGLVKSGTNETIYPDGPYSNSSYNVTATQGNIWIAPGGQGNLNSPTENKEGYSHFNTNNWIHVPYDNMDNAQDIVHINVNPSDINDVYVASWGHGLLRMNNDVLANHYTLTSLTGSLRVGGSTFDTDGNLIVSESFTPEGNGMAVKLPNGVWRYTNISNYDVSGGGGIREPFIDANNYAWLASTRGRGLVVGKGNEFYGINTTNSRLPVNNILAVAHDKNSVAWIGTANGLRIYRDPINSLKSNQYTLEMIIIKQNNIAEELLKDVRINNIKVDGANRKWIATEGAGVYLFSDDGQQIVYHFTESNSPLPSNIVYAMAVDDSTGKVYFATSKGLVSYLSDAKTVDDKFANVVVYPNPVRPNYTGKIYLKGLANNAEIKITDAIGNLMYQTIAKGGLAEWDANNAQGRPVASGIYLIMMINSDGSEKATEKIAIIR